MTPEDGSPQMTPEDFTAWLAFMRMKRYALTDADAAKQLGVHANTMSRWKRHGAPFHVGLACAALIDQLPPWQVKHVF